MEKVKLKPILFNTEMVRAILGNGKTVTRRVLKTEKYIPDDAEFGYTAYTPKNHISCRGTFFDENGDKRYGENYIKMPYQKGDILYVRETWCINNIIPHYPEWLYKADYDCTIKPYCNWKWRPSIHMPKEAARIFLRITDVRVERVQDIRLKDCLAEGVQLTFLEQRDNAKKGWIAWNRYSSVWNSTIKKSDIAKYGWDANPWVEVVEFERISKEEALNESI